MHIPNMFIFLYTQRINQNVMKHRNNNNRKEYNNNIKEKHVFYIVIAKKGNELLRK